MRLLSKSLISYVSSRQKSQILDSVQNHLFRTFHHLFHSFVNIQLLIFRLCFAPFDACRFSTALAVIVKHIIPV